MAYTLGAISRARLIGVHPDLVRVVLRAIEITPQDFTVFEGVRTPATQADYVRRRVSKTMSSRHLTGHAVDLVPWIAGQPRWEWPPIYIVADAVRRAALAEGVAIIWGGVWDRRLGDLPPHASGLAVAVRSYSARHSGPDFLDGPHFELHV